MNMNSQIFLFIKLPTEEDGALISVSTSKRSPKSKDYRLEQYVVFFYFSQKIRFDISVSSFLSLFFLFFHGH